MIRNAGFLLVCHVALALAGSAGPAQAMTGSPAASPRSHTRASQGPALAADQGALYVYARPLPAEAARLDFTLRELAVIREDGTLLPLATPRTALAAKDLTRERRLAGQGLPEGRYAGLAVRAGDATLRGTQGPVPLQAPGEAVRIDAPFIVERQKAVVLLLALDYARSMGEGFRFQPAWSAAPPRRPAIGLIGVASSRRANALILFDKTAGDVAGVVPTGRAPSGLAIDADRRRAYVALAGEDAVQAIGLLEQSVLSRIQLRGGDEPAELALTPDGRTLLAADGGSSTVSVIDAVAAVETGRIGVGDQPRSVTLDRAGRRAYVFNEGSSTVSVVDLQARAVVATIATEAGPFRGQFNRSGTRLFVVHRASPYMTIIDPSTNAVSNRIYVGSGATTLKVDSESDRIYVARRGAGEVQVFDPLSLLPVDAFPVDGDVSFLSIDGEGNSLWLAMPGTDQVEAIRIVGRTAAARVDVGDDPYAVALLGER